MKLTILGSGSPEAYLRRASSGYLVEVAGQRILFDCGGGVVDRLLQAGLMPSDIDYLFFSHLHSDHMMDYARLVHAAWDESNKIIKVIGPAPIGEITKRYFGPDGALSYDLRARTELKGSQDVWVARGGTLPRPWPSPEVTEVEPGFIYEGDGWTVTSCAAMHAQPFLECMALSLTANGKRFVYSGDTGITDETEAFFAGADLLLHWCYRQNDGASVSDFMRRGSPTPVQIAAMAERVGAKHLLLTHFRVHMDDPDRLAQSKKELADGFSGPSGVAEDLDVYMIE